MASNSAAPISDAQLQKITKDACDYTLSPVTSYIHAETESWNASIINTILQGLITTATSYDDTPSEALQYKYAVNSTIIQHLSDPAPSTSTSTFTGTSTVPSTSSPSQPQSTETTENTQTISPPSTPDARTVASGAGSTVNGHNNEPEKGRRGMHSATGAYWNNETDGMWSYKWQGGEGKGMDVVVSVLWVAVG